MRGDRFDWTAILPGDTSEALWDTYLPYDALPQVLNPPSGLVFNTNHTPFQATVGQGNPNPADFSPTLGIETTWASPWKGSSGCGGVKRICLSAEAPTPSTPFTPGASRTRWWANPGIPTSSKK